MAWASSGYWVPTVHVDLDPRDLWLFGGDKLTIAPTGELIIQVRGSLS